MKSAFRTRPWRTDRGVGVPELLAEDGNATVTAVQLLTSAATHFSGSAQMSCKTCMQVQLPTIPLKHTLLARRIYLFSYFSWQPAIGSAYLSCQCT